MSISNYQYKRIVSVMDQMFQRSISHMFAQPVDPVRDNCQNYFEIVKKPMDLGTVKKKVDNREYNSVQEWRDDCELVWSNSFAFNPRNSILSLITAEMQALFRRISNNLTDNGVADWTNQLNSLRDDFVAITKRGADVFKEPSAVKKAAAKQKTHRRSPGSNLMEPAPQKPPAISKDFVVKLTEDINNLRLESQVRAIVDILHANEPELQIEGDQLEVDMNSLKPATLRALRDKVDYFFQSNQAH